MKMSTRLLPLLCGFALAAVSAQAQFYKLHEADISGGAIGQFTTPLTDGTGSTIEADNKNSLGGMITLSEHPVPWAGIEFNYAYNEYGSTITQFAAPTYSQYVHTDAHEATAAYLFHPRSRFFSKKIQPFVAVGGGYIDFVPSYAGSNQWRGTGLVEVGFDIPTSNPHFGFKVEGRELIYRSPNFNQSDLASKQWVTTNEPMFGVYYRF
jgi:hypothetical protein